MFLILIKQICLLLSGGGYTRHWDDEGQVPYAVSGLNWIGYEDVRSVQLKMDFIRNEGYGGAQIWAIDHDDTQSVCGPAYPLSTTVHNAMKDHYAEIQSAPIDDRLG